MAAVYNKLTLLLQSSLHAGITAPHHTSLVLTRPHVITDRATHLCGGRDGSKGRPPRVVSPSAHVGSPPYVRLCFVEFRFFGSSTGYQIRRGCAYTTVHVQSLLHVRYCPLLEGVTAPRKRRLLPLGRVFNLACYRPSSVMPLFGTCSELTRQGCRRHDRLRNSRCVRKSRRFGQITSALTQVPRRPNSATTPTPINFTTLR